MTKDANDASISELIYYINVLNPNFEYKEQIEEIINRKLKILYEFTDEEIKTLKLIEIEKFKNRGSNIDNYLFSYNLDSKKKIEIIHSLYEKDELYKLSFCELAIAINLMIVIEDTYYNKRTIAKTKNNEDLYKIANDNYEKICNISDELIENYNEIVLNQENSNRFRRVYVKECLPNDDEKIDIKKILKNKKLKR